MVEIDKQAETDYATTRTTEDTSGEKIVTEEEWFACTDPQRMLEFLRGKVSSRKLRLFGVASCRRIWHLLTDERSRRGVEVAEQYLEGRIGKEELYKAMVLSHTAYMEFKASKATTAGNTLESALSHWYAAAIPFAAYSATCCDDPVEPESEIECIVGRPATGQKGPGIMGEGSGELQASQPGLFRDIFGPLPFRSITISPAHPTWNDGTVQKVAQAIYDERAFDRMPILADALEEAGCTNVEILNHCRQPGNHVRGCWVVDMILGKE
jgi:hypothetical protein